MRLLLYPLALLYYCVTKTRNLLFDFGILHATSFPIPIICVGNLAAGGTGKTPFISYLISLLEQDYHIAVLSRGYGRNTNGFLEVNENSFAEEVGDEPLLLKQKHPKTMVVVDANRRRAIRHIINNNPKINMILMDDGFQHRWVKAGLYILITDYHLPFYSDYLLPIGRLRESKSEVKRANMIVVSKCPHPMEKEDKTQILQKINSTTQDCYFSYIQYAPWRSIFKEETTNNNTIYSITLVCGIANPTILQKKLQKEGHRVHLIRFADHHCYTQKDVAKILQQYHQDKSVKKLILTTEKDAVKLKGFYSEFQDTACYIAPIETALYEEEKLVNRIKNYVRGN